MGVLPTVCGCRTARLAAVRSPPWLQLRQQRHPALHLSAVPPQLR
eukprot:COSAG03_NODE_20155_length_323_cov_1.611607_1_plen_44_part_10